ncbi:MAG: hypothetical protein M0037_00740 [Betaproteobacteria bacterium]|nr:hypothetical protein [Betaproteobacteria bacterium]
MNELNLAHGGAPSTGMSLPSLEALLTSGGGARIALDASGRNPYGCGVYPQPALAAWGSSTASVISANGFAAAQRLYRSLQDRLGDASPDEVYRVERDRIRRELVELAGLSCVPDLEVILSPSGTEAHAAATALVGAPTGEPPVVVTISPAETGRSVPEALRSFGGALVPIPIRLPDGRARPSAEVDADFEAAVRRMVRAGRRVLVVSVDVSKTGLIAPSAGCLRSLAAQWPDALDVLVDACQFRLSDRSLRAYLGAGFMVAITGSKFVTGPSFSGALLIPASAAQKLQERLPSGFAWSTESDPWTCNRGGASPLQDNANFGLVMRWEAALEELRAFRQVPDEKVLGFLTRLAAAIQLHLRSDPSFDFIDAWPLDRGIPNNESSWDRVPTIFSFMLRHEHGWLDPAQTAWVYRSMQAQGISPTNRSGGRQQRLRYQLGQPVACGIRCGQPVTALRVCASARLVVEASRPGGSEAMLIAQATAALNEAAELSRIVARMGPGGCKGTM